MGMISRILSIKTRRLFNIEEPPKEVYPLGLRLNAVVRFDQTPFILAGDQLTLECPDGDSIVYAVGRYKFFDLDGYRFYLKNLKDEESVLQVTVDKGNPVEIILFRTFDEVMPQTADEWMAWLDEEEGHIGAQLFNTPNELTYQRVYGENVRQTPFSFIERISLPDGGFNIDHYCMYYSRLVENEGQQIGEQMLVSKEETGSGDNAEAMIRISTGIEVNPQSLTIL